MGVAMSPEGSGEISNEFFKKLNQQIVQKDNLIKLLQLQIKNLKSQIESVDSGSEGLEELKKSLDEKTAEVDKLAAELKTQKKQFEELDKKKEEQIQLLNKMLEEHKSAQQAQTTEDSPQIEEKILELESLVASLREELENERAAKAELESQLQNAPHQETPTTGNEAIQAELDQALHDLSDREDELTQYSEQIKSLEQEIQQLKDELANAPSTPPEELEALKTENARLFDVQANEIQAYKEEVIALNKHLDERTKELNALKAAYEEAKEESIADPQVRREIEQLTKQTADQLLAIQKFETMVKQTTAELEEKELEVERLQAEMMEMAPPVIPVDGESDVVISFIDFFDGLDSILSKNPIPELQTLHQKLLDRLILPNQISYMPSLCEEFDPERHIATDYFRSSQFPEKCVVFEVEKGYIKGNTVIKKSKVWVVQNLFNCQSCNAMQTNSNSRFCHLCGKRIMVPNGLPADSLPEFEPTSVTYQRFVDRMLEKGDRRAAKEYLVAGLQMDSHSVPLLVRHADFLVAESKFEEAMEMLTRANSIKQDQKIIDAMKALEVKLNIFKQAQSLQLAPEEFDKLMLLIQK